jgi:hypothetical protein
MIYDINELDLIKSITRAQAKAVHGELPAGGEWRTIKGHHIYIKDGKVLAGSIPGVTKAKKATKAQLAEHQATIDKESKANGKSKGKATAKPGSAKKKAGSVAKKGAEKKAKEPAKSAAKGIKAKEKADGAPKKTTSKTKSGTEGAKTNAKSAKPKGTGKSVSGAKKATTEGKPTSKPAAAKGKSKDIRHEAQKNRELAYDVGEKVGGARKDEFIASFKEKPTAKSLDELEKMSGAVAEKMVTKAHLLPKFDAQSEMDNGVDLPTAVLKKLILDRIAPKPEPSNPQTRREYMNAMLKLHRHLAGIKDFEQMRNAVRELSEYARASSTKNFASWAHTIEYQTKRANGISSYERFPLTQDEIDKAKKLKKEYEDRLADGFAKKRAFNFEALGDKLNNFFTDYESRERTMQSVRKTAAGGWEKYLGKKTAAPKKPRGEENKKWERKAEAKDLRTGGKKVKMDKPEELMKTFGIRGVEFGNWVNDASGKYHLQRSAEALHDLADVIGVDPKDISLNGRLALAFGARGKGTALAHYEPDRKVINMTKYGGAGSLAHEWGHAMDNILHQYSEGGRESLSFGSQQQMGNHDPKLKALYDNLMEAITKPAPGEKGGKVQLILDSEAKSLSRYYPEMRRQVENGMEPLDVYNHWASKINEQYDRYVSNAASSTLRTPSDRAKAVKQYEQKRKRELTDIGHYLAHELRRKQNGGKYGGDHYKGHIEIPTGKSEYLTRMEETQPNKMQNGVHYYSAPEEMFARVFESYVQDKLDKEKRYNNYLVHGTREGNVKADGAPFPLGKERQHMFKAMDSLMKYIGKEKALKKALMLDILASGSGDMTEELRKSLGYTKRSAYNVENPEEVIYIPINRLRTVYQTEEATNWDKVKENQARMEAGDNLDPVSIGFDYDVHDGHHRIEAAKLCGHEHVPCIVKGGNELERQRAEEAYREIWKSLDASWDNMLSYFKDKLKDGESIDGAYEETIEHFDRDYGEEMDFRAILKKHGYKVQDHFWVNKSIITDPVAPESAPFRFDESFMFRGIGQKEFDFIIKHGYIQTKGKGNDEDKDVKTCFTNLYSQAAGYARSNYDLYKEPQAYVLAVPKIEGFEDETGEIAIPYQVPFKGSVVIPIPKELEQP